jgi:MYXO-CTERM domain-containing protein
MTASGPFEVWVNGTKTASASINLVVGGDPPTIRWSTGIYCTAWRTQQPAGGSPISVWHDHLRVATTYNEAEPANWGNPSLVDAGAADGPATPDAAISDVRAGDIGSAGAGGSDAGGSAGGVGGASGGAGAGGAATGGRSGSGGTAGATAGRGGTGGAPGPSQKHSGCACAVGTRGRAPSGPVLLVLAFAAAAFARRRTKRAT